MHQNASPHNNWTCIWVNHNNSLTWKVRPFRDDSPIKTMITGFGRDVRSWSNLPRCTVNSSVSGNARKNSGTHHGSAISGRQTAKAFLLNHFWTDIELQTCFWRGGSGCDMMWWLANLPMGWRTNNGFAKTWRHGWLYCTLKNSVPSDLQPCEQRSSYSKYLRVKWSSMSPERYIEAPKNSPNMISRQRQIQL